MSLRNIVSQFWREFRTQLPISIANHRKLIALLVVGGTAFLCVAVVGGWTFMNSAFFCGSCHNMEPYKISWENSKHKDVNCTDCHLPPGFVNHLKHKMIDGMLSGVYFLTGKGPSKAHATVSSDACKLCHTPEDLGKKAVDYKGALFEHSKHLGKLRNGITPQCTTCHEQNINDKHIVVTTEVCFQCHLYNTAENDPWGECNICHTAFQKEITLGDREFQHAEFIQRGIGCQNCHMYMIDNDATIPDTKCVQCHADPEIVRGEFTKEEVHHHHVTSHKVECYSCHGIIEHRIVDESIGTSHNCQNCHPEKMMHSPQELMYLGKGGVGVEGKPFRKYLSHMDCSSCHTQDGEAWIGDHSNFKSDNAESTCVHCHGEGFDEMVRHWTKLMEEQCMETVNLLKMADAKLAKLSNKSSEEYKKAEALLKDAHANCGYVMEAKGIHNIEFAVDLLNEARNRTVAALELVGLSTAGRDELIETGCASMCHADVLDKNMELAAGAVFPHVVHVDDEGLECADCHSSRAEHGKVFIQNCNECHHGDGVVECGNCHTDQATLFNGLQLMDIQGEPNFKIEDAEVGCADCHAGVAGGAMSDKDGVRETCIECHDDEMGATLDDWQKEAAAVLGDLDEKLARAIALEDECIEQCKNVDIPMRKINLASEAMETIKSGNAVHNLEYAKVAADRASGMLDEAIISLEAKLAHE